MKILSDNIKEQQTSQPSADDCEHFPPCERKSHKRAN